MPLRLVTAAVCLAAAVVAVTPSSPRAPAARDSAARIESGLAQERSGDFSSAEATLLAAARYDRQYLPAWTLANYYFRRGNRSAFWTWAARAAAVNRYDLRPLLRLANAFEPDPAVLVAHLGDRPEILRPYLDLLIAEERIEDAAWAAAHLAAHRNPADVERLRAFELRKIRSSARQ